MKICIIGGSGVIGSKMVQFFSKMGHEVISTFHTNEMSNFTNTHRLDITNKDATVNFLEKNNPEVIIHTSAIANIDLCETNKDLAYLVNVKGTENVIEGCKQIKAKLAYVSTSYVFDGKKDEYFEDDKPSSSTYYGYTKLKGEEAVIKSGLSHLILRIDQPYCWIEPWQHTNSVVRVFETLKSDKILHEVEDWYNTPTYVHDIVLVASELIKKKSEGIFHLVGSDFINRYNWSIEVAKIFNLDHTNIKPINSKKLNVQVKRSNINLKNFKVKEEINLKMKGISEGAIAMLNEI